MSQSYRLRADRLVYADFARKAPAFTPRRVRGRYAQGLRYERRAKEYLQAQYAERFVGSPWILYRLRGESRRRFAQPDGIIFDVPGGRLTIVEIKYQHTADAYFQLEELYYPLLRWMFPPELWSIVVVELVKWYDCDVEFPTGVRLVDRIERVQPGEFGVHIWKPNTG